jgi:hypothetical protein
MKRLVLCLLLGAVAVSGQSLTPESIVRQERERYPASLPAADVVPLLRAIVARLNAAAIPGGPYGILEKTSGTNCDGFSCDIVCTGQGPAQKQWDVLGDVDGPGRPARPTWDGPLATIVVRRCVFEASTPPPPPPPPNCESCNSERQQLRDALEAAQRRIDAVTADNLLLRETHAREWAEIAKLRSEKQALEDALGAVRCRAKAPGWLRIGCEIVR